MKKPTRFWILLVLFLLGLSIVASADHADQLIEMVARNDADITYMSGIMVDLGDGSYTIREQSHTLSAKPFKTGGSLLVPAVSLAEAIGCRAFVSGNGVTVSCFDGSVSKTFAYASMPAGLVEGSFRPSDKLAYVKNGTTYITLKAFEEATLASSLLLDDNRLQLCRFYQTARLMVDCDASEICDFINGAQESVQAFDNLLVLQYASEKEAKDANLAMRAAGIESYPDAIAHPTVTNGMNRIGAGNYKNYATTYQKTDNTGGYTVAAILDTGIDLGHSYFSGRLYHWESFMGDNNPGDEDGHGTHVAGIVAKSTHSGIKLMSLKVMGPDGGTTSIIDTGIRKAAEYGAKAINLSLAVDLTERELDMPYFKSAVREANEKGASVCAAAGNESVNVTYRTPARIPACITVVATDTYTDAIASYCNYGSAIDIAAPGENILSAAVGGGTCYLSGTSMATPFVTAAAIMVYRNNNLLSPEQVQTLLKTYAVDARSNHNVFGAGILNLNHITRTDKKSAIDSPADWGITEDDCTLLIAGWALSPYSMSAFSYSIDGGVEVPMQGFSRDDVTDVWCMYTTENAAFSVAIDAASLGEGGHSVTVYATDRHGDKWSIGTRPFQNAYRCVVDEAAFDGDTLNISGWAIHRSYDVRVTALLNGRELEATERTERTDVQNAYPDYFKGSGGYRFTIPSSALTSGTYTLQMRLYYTDTQYVVFYEAPITIELRTYPVTVTCNIDGVISGAASALAGHDYVLSPHLPAGYGFSRVSATVGNEVLDITDTLLIPGANITDAISIHAEARPYGYEASMEGVTRLADGGTMTLTYTPFFPANITAPQHAQIHFICYDSQGVMTQIFSITGALAPHGGGVSFSVPVPKGTAAVKACLWDQLTPLCASIEK